MKTTRIWLLMSVLMMLPACRDRIALSTKVTVFVIDMGKVRQGSAVWTVAYQKAFPGLVRDYSVTLHGMPVEVKLSKGQSLVLPPILRNGRPNKGAALLAESSFPPPRGQYPAGRIPLLRQLAGEIGKSAYVKCPQYRISGARPETINDAATLCMETFTLPSPNSKSGDATGQMVHLKPALIAAIKLQIVSHQQSPAEEQYQGFPTFYHK